MNLTVGSVWGWLLPFDVEWSGACAFVCCFFVSFLVTSMAASLMNLMFADAHADLMQ